MARRGVHEPPGRAARGLIDWAIDLWPYINGKALAAGIRLSGLEASDMLDLLHYYFEEDMNYSTAEQSEAASKTRENIYSKLYGREYKYTTKPAPTSRTYTEDYGDITPESNVPNADIQPFNPQKQPTKAYVPPTEFDGTAQDPFGAILDSPLK